MNTILKKIVAILVSVITLINPLVANINLIRTISVVSVPVFFNSIDAFSDTISDTGKQGMSFGKSLIKGNTLPSVDQSTGTMSIPTQSGSISLQKSDLYQNLQDSTSPESSYGSDVQVNQMTEQTILQYMDTNNTLPTANAYRTIKGSTVNAIPKLTQGDPIAARARDIYSDKNGDLTAILSSCTSNTTTTGENFVVVGSPQIQTCDDLTVSDKNCEVTRDLQIDTHLIGFILHVGDNNDSGLPNGSWGKCKLDFKNGTTTCSPPSQTYCSVPFSCQFGGGGGGNSCNPIFGNCADQPDPCAPVCQTYYYYHPNTYFSMSIANTMPFESLCEENNTYFTIRTSSPSGIDITSPNAPPITNNGNGVGYLIAEQSPSCSNGMVGIYDFQVSCGEDPCVSGPPPFMFTSVIGRVTIDEWHFSESCPSVLNAITDGTICTGNVSCDTDDANGCVMISGILHCPGGPASQNIKPTPDLLASKGINNLCTKVSVNKSCNTCLDPTLCDPANAPTENCTQFSSDQNCRLLRQDCLEGFANPDGSGCYGYQETYDCDPTITHTPQYRNCTKSQMTTSEPVTICEKDSNSIESCQTYASSSPYNSCTSYESDQRCKLVYEDCAQGQKDANGYCHVQQKTYDCGYPSPDKVQSQTTATCNGATIRCLGSDCIDVPTENNNDFGKVVVNANIINYAQQDSACGTTGNCEFFKGKYYDCKTGFFGIVDCCVDAKGVSPFKYMELLYNTWSLAQRFELGETLASTLADNSGAIADLMTSTSSLSDLLSPITSPFDQISSTVGGVFLQQNGMWLNISPQISTGLQSFVSGVFGDNVSSMMFDLMDDGVSYALNVQNLMSTISPLLTAYQIYQIAVMIIQILYSCEDREFELAANKAMKLCHYNGRFCAKKILGSCVLRKRSYCCFNSPFSRIMSEQARLQINKPFGDPEHPDCSGMSIAELTQLDFSKIDLSEWLSLLKIGNLQDTSTANANTNFSLENLTKYSDKAATNKDNVYDRVEKGISNVDLTKKREELAP